MIWPKGPLHSLPKTPDPHPVFRESGRTCLYVCLYVCNYVCMHVGRQAGMHRYTCIYNIYPHARTHACIHAYMHTHLDTPTDIPTYRHIADGSGCGPSWRGLRSRGLRPHSTVSRSIRSGWNRFGFSVCLHCAPQDGTRSIRM